MPAGLYPPVRDADAVLRALEVACRAHPDQRAMQVIINALGTDPFYVEDDAAEAALYEYAGR